MSKKILKLVVPVESTLKLKKSTRNIYRFINKVPCDAEKYNKPSQLSEYISEQLSEYPIPKRVQSPQPRMRYESLKENIRQNYLKDREIRLMKLALKLQKKINYLELQQLRQLIPALTKVEIKKHEKQLKLVSYKINYTLQKGGFEQQYMMDQAKQIVEQINKILNTKAKQLF